MHEELDNSKGSEFLILLVIIIKSCSNLETHVLFCRTVPHHSHRHSHQNRHIGVLYRCIRSCNQIVQVHKVSLWMIKWLEYYEK